MLLCQQGVENPYVYQLPALIQPGTAIVVSPLIALMKNQVDAIRGISNNDGIAHVLNSSLSKTQIQIVKDDITKGINEAALCGTRVLNKRGQCGFSAQCPH